MKIALVGKFKKLHDEEYIARSFEMLGHDVYRIEQNNPVELAHAKIYRTRPDILLFTKWEYTKMIRDLMKKGKQEWGMKTVCWLFDLYWGYEREFRIKTEPYFKADFVITTDGGHDDDWKKAGINHRTVRQGIYAPECFTLESTIAEGIAFIGSENPFYLERTKMILELKKDYGLNFRWYGRTNTDAVRGTDLNHVFSVKKIIVGDSVYSPHYWSNRIVETLGRGGFLIHRDVPGLKEEYPDLVTYDGTYPDLKAKIDYYLSHEDERKAIVQKNYEWVKNRYTMDKKCEELINHVKI